MKTILALVAAASMTLMPQANAQSSEEQLLGAIAGYYLGNSVGDGDGRRAARVIGAVIGYRYGNEILGSRDRQQFMSMDRNDFHYHCSHQVPYQYNRQHNTRNMWIRGCVNRLSQQQRQFEREAYEDGLYGSSN